MWIEVTSVYGDINIINTDQIVRIVLDTQHNDQATVFFAVPAGSNNSYMQSIEITISPDDLRCLLTGDKLSKLVKLGISDV